MLAEMNDYIGKKVTHRKFAGVFNIVEAKVIINIGDDQKPVIMLGLEAEGGGNRRYKPAPECYEWNTPVEN